MTGVCSNRIQLRRPVPYRKEITMTFNNRTEKERKKKLVVLYVLNGTFPSDHGSRASESFGVI